MTLLTLVRHGETDWNAERRLQGRTDIPLNARGEEQARAAATLLDAHSASLGPVVSSPLGRAAATADAIAQRHGLVRAPHRPDLTERGFGEAEGLRVLEADERWPDGVFPGAETAEECAARGAAEFHALARSRDGLIVVAHGALIALALRELTEDATVAFPVNGEVIRVTARSTGPWRVLERLAPNLPAV